MVRLMTGMFMHMRNKMQDQKGATAVEYGIMVALIAAVIVSTVGLLGTEVEGAFDRVYDALIAAAPTP